MHSWSDPRREKTAVRDGYNLLGYVIGVSYPGRELTAYQEGLPYDEIVITTTRQDPVAWLRRFRMHWLIRCGDNQDTVEVCNNLSADQAMAIAKNALQQPALQGAALVEELKTQMQTLLGTMSDDL
jgi:hypothetical protein